MPKELSENYSSMKMTETINKNQLKMKDTISSMKNTLKAIKRRLDESEDQIRAGTQGRKEYRQSNKMKKD